MLKLCPTEPGISSTEGMELYKGPALNIGRLSLPMFKGNVRGFAKFLKNLKVQLDYNSLTPR